MCVKWTMFVSKLTQKWIKPTQDRAISNTRQHRYIFVPKLTQKWMKPTQDRTVSNTRQHRYTDRRLVGHPLPLSTTTLTCAADTTDNKVLSSTCTYNEELNELYMCTNQHNGGDGGCWYMCVCVYLTGTLSSSHMYNCI